jgi:GH15 family glucan-1,4-alpha-glucosidase
MKNLDYGIIGNCKSAALISKTAAIEWLCFPDFDSGSVFARILDDEKGGEFGILVDEDYVIHQAYIKETNILKTSFIKNNVKFEIIDFMPRYKNTNGSIYCPSDLIRYIRIQSGVPEIKINYNPKLAYAKYPTETVIEDEWIKSYTTKGQYESVYLYTSIDFSKIVNKDKIKLKEDAFFLLSYNQKILDIDITKIYLEYERTKVYWLNWTNKMMHFKEYDDEITRSSLVLKLLTYQKTGAILAAATTSIPETIGEERNWDYRYCWIRDASMTIRILTELGHYKSAERFLNFIMGIISFKDEKMQIMYGIKGEKKLSEIVLHHLSGYEGSKPVRIGNAAYLQKQNDIYGVLIDVIFENFLLFKNTLGNSEDLWTIVRSLVKTVKNDWKKPDKGIWECRSQNKHYTFSKVLSWVAIDRAIKIARLIKKDQYIIPWAKLRDLIKINILENGWNEEINAFTQYYGSRDLDAANLLMEHYHFLKADDPKFISTVKKTKDELCRNGLMYRYKNQDDFGKPSSSFTVCTFWLIKSLYRIDEKEEAKKMFNNTLKYSNHLGLYSEDMDFETKRLLGNFPQAYSHLALIDTALALSNYQLREDTVIEDVLN